MSRFTPERLDPEEGWYIQDENLDWEVLCGEKIIFLGDGQRFVGQTGGFACWHPRVCGTLMSGDAQFSAALKRIEMHIYGKYAGWCVPLAFKEYLDDPGNSGSLLTDKDADDIDWILQSFGLSNIWLDRSRLKESSEGWYYAFCGDKPCVLVTNNSD